MSSIHQQRPLIIALLKIPYQVLLFLDRHAALSITSVAHFYFFLTQVGSSEKEKRKSKKKKP